MNLLVYLYDGRTHVLLMEKQPQNQTQRRQVPLEELISHIAEVCHDTGVPVQDILSPLVANGRLYQDGSPEFAAAITELNRRRILRRTSIRLRGSRQEYAIAIRFAVTLERLQQVDGDH